MTAAIVDRLEAEIAAGSIPPFVYSYPPRSAYRTSRLPWRISDIWRADKENSGSSLNLYIHVPFCGYKCGFCNLYTITSRDERIYDQYVQALCREILSLGHVFSERILRTVYIGGGTPSRLGADHFHDIFSAIDRVSPQWRNTVAEICIEASPDSLSTPGGRATLVELAELGLTRVNLGVQSLEAEELRQAGRSASGPDAVTRAVDAVRNAGIANLSTDLIIGFQGQTDVSWRRSVDRLLRLEPETISTYFLTIRPDAWFSRTGRYGYTRDPALYERYEYGRGSFEGAGYRQQTNVRYVLPGRGGYLQKQLQFKGVPVLGVGLGARTYTNTIDYLSHTPLFPAKAALDRYIAIAGKTDYVNHGFVYTREERIRKRIALDLFDLKVADIDDPSGVFRHVYEPIFDAAARCGLADWSGGRVRLTPRGYKYRDILSWLAASDLVRELDSEFYEELKSSRSRSSSLRLGSAHAEATLELSV